MRGSRLYTNDDLVYLSTWTISLLRCTEADGRRLKVALKVRHDQRHKESVYRTLHSKAL